MKRVPSFTASQAMVPEVAPVKSAVSPTISQSTLKGTSREPETVSGTQSAPWRSSAIASWSVTAAKPSARVW